MWHGWVCSHSPNTALCKYRSLMVRGAHTHQRGGGKERETGVEGEGKEGREGGRKEERKRKRE